MAEVRFESQQLISSLKGYTASFLLNMTFFHGIQISLALKNK